MTPHKQLFRHKPAEGMWGDCARTVIACMLDLEPEAVPHQQYEVADGEQDRFLNEWLATRGLRLVQVPYDDEPEAIMKVMASMYPGLTYLIAGTSKTGVNHFCIAKDDAIIWDPSLTNAGIVGRSDDGHTWVGHLVHVSPT